MFGYWNDFERTFAAVDDLRRRVQQAMGEAEEPYETVGWPQVALWDTGANLVLKADLPGITEKDVNVQLTQDVLTLSGERRVEVPEGRTVHRQERVAARFSRAFSLPFKVSPDAISATLKDGVLTVTLPKVPEAQPRQIAVKAG